MPVEVGEGGEPLYIPPPVPVPYVPPVKPPLQPSEPGAGEGAGGVVPPPSEPPFPPVPPPPPPTPPKPKPPTMPPDDGDDHTPPPPPPPKPDDPEDGADGQDPDTVDEGNEQDEGTLQLLALGAGCTPGSILGTPNSPDPKSTHSHYFNCVSPGGSCNWQSMNAYDLCLPAGAQVLAVADGTISPGSWGYGPSGHGGRFTGSRVHLVTAQRGLVFFYTHLQSIAVAKGRKVKKGDLIGYAGALNHVHFAAQPPFDPWVWLGLISTYHVVGKKGEPPAPADPATPTPPPLPGELRDDEVGAAWLALQRTIGRTLPAATGHIRDARRSLDDAVS